MYANGIWATINEMMTVAHTGIGKSVHGAGVVVKDNPFLSDCYWLSFDCMVKECFMSEAPRVLQTVAFLGAGGESV